MCFGCTIPRTIIDCIKRRNPFRTPKQSCCSLIQYCRGGPGGNRGCCSPFFAGSKCPSFFFLDQKKLHHQYERRFFLCLPFFCLCCAEGYTLTMSSRVHVLVHADPDSSRTQLVRVPKTKKRCMLYAVWSTKTTEQLKFPFFFFRNTYHIYRTAGPGRHFPEPENQRPA